MHRDIGLTQLGNRLSGETNIESILALDEQIREHEMAIARLKRSRNSLLNVSKLPPEVLGKIFRWNVTLKGDFDGLEEQSHNFLLVCHHWFEVASSTPELWCFWGNTPKDWARWHRRSGTMPIDLVLDAEEGNGFLNGTLGIVLRRRAIRDTIRRVHLKSSNIDLLRSVIYELTAAPQHPRSTSVESLILQDRGASGSVDISSFLTYLTFPKLQRLELFDCMFWPWDLIMSRTPVLTTLSFHIRGIWCSDNPTTPQLLSILASYPTLQKLSLSWLEEPDRRGGGYSDDGGGDTSPRVQLHHLRELELDGWLRDVFMLLDRLDHPRHMDHLFISMDGCDVEDISRIIGPYLRDYLSNRGGFQNELGLSLRLPYTDTIELQIGDAGGVDFSSPVPARMNTFVTITIELDQEPLRQLGKAILNLITYTPQEEVVYFLVCGKPVAMEDISIQLSNLRGLHFEKTPLTAAFPKSLLDRDGDIFPSLEYILLDSVVVDRGDWSPLTTFLDWRVSRGDRLRALGMIGTYPTAPSDLRGLKDVVREFKHGTSGSTAP